MKNIRRGNDIRFRWQIRRGEDAESFDGKDISVVLRDQFGNSCDVEWSIANGGIISGVSRGKTQSKLGVYTLTLVENDGANDMATVDKISAWRLVAVQDASLVDDEATNDCGNISVEVIELESEIGLGSLPMSIDPELNPDSNNAIANSAVTKGINAVGEMTEEEIQDVVNNSSVYYPQKTKKKKQQIIIGRAIKPTSVSRGDVENWYAFIDNPCLVVRNTEKFTLKKPEVHLYTKQFGTDEDYHKTGISVILPHRILFQPDFGQVMFKVDRYQRAGYSHEIYLSYKRAPFTLRGTSITQEWQNGKRVCNKSIYKEKIVADLKCWIREDEHLYSDLEYRRITSRHKTKRVRLLAKQMPHIKAKCRREVSWLLGTSKKRELKSGLFKVRSVKNGYKTNWQTIYVRITRDKNYNEKLGDVTFK